MEIISANSVINGAITIANERGVFTIQRGDVVTYKSSTGNREIKEGVVSKMVNMVAHIPSAEPRWLPVIGSQKDSLHETAIYGVRQMVQADRDAIAAKKSERKTAKTEAKSNPYSELSPVTQYLYTIDGGAKLDLMDRSTYCPHCGAEGRYIIVFLCEDGQEREAMQGCFKMWPKAKGFKR